MDKSQLRRHLRRQRNQLDPRQRRAAALGLLKVAMREGLLLKYRRIGFYLPFEGEMDLLPLLNRALELGKSCYLPVVPRRFEKKLNFTRLTDRRSWYRNRFGIHEHWSPRPVRARQLDLLLMPLVGFDHAGYRLGMGGGFYDTSLAYLRRRKAWSKPHLVGIGYECQIVPEVPRDQMRVGDQVFFYHSNCDEPGIAGLAEVSKLAYPDQTQFDPAHKYFDPKATPETPRWFNVDVRLKKKTRLLSLKELRGYPELEHMRVLQKGNRLSITPVDPKEWAFILGIL